MTFGPILILLSMQLITSRPDSMLINNAFGMKNHCLKVELLELNAIHKLSSHMPPSVTVILLILQNNQFLFAHLKTSHIKSNILSNGQEITLKEHLLNHQIIWLVSMKIDQIS